MFTQNQSPKSMPLCKRFHTTLHRHKKNWKFRDPGGRGYSLLGWMEVGA